MGRDGDLKPIPGEGRPVPGASLLSVTLGWRHWTGPFTNSATHFFPIHACWIFASISTAYVQFPASPCLPPFTLIRILASSMVAFRCHFGVLRIEHLAMLVFYKHIPYLQTLQEEMWH